MHLRRAVAVLFGLATCAPAAAGIVLPEPPDSAIDTSFAAGSGTLGWARMKAVNGDERAVGFAETPDGHYIAALAVPGGVNGPQLVLFRRKLDGTPDGDLDLDPGFSGITAMTVDAQGRTIVVGRTPGPGGVGDIRVVRFSADGTLDGSFSGDGIATFGFDGLSSSDDAPTSVLAQADGRIVIAGNSQHSGFPSRYSLLRVTESGTLDSTFGSIGDGMGGRKGTMDSFVEDRPAYAAKVLEMAGGYFVVVGTSVVNDLDTDFAATIVTPTGSPWANFVGSGTFPIDEPGPGNSLYDTATSAVRIDPRTVLIVGNASGFGAARRIRMGDPGIPGSYTTLETDTSFVGSAIAARPNRYVSDTAAYINDAAVRADGTVMLVGRQLTFEGATYGYAERLLPNGARDSGFAGTDEYATYAAPTSAAGDSYSTEFVAVLVDDGRPVLLGTSADASGSATDLDAVMTRLDSARVSPPPLFRNGFEAPVE